MFKLKNLRSLISITHKKSTPIYLYCFVCFYSAFVFYDTPEYGKSDMPGVTCIKPLMGIDSFLEENLESYFKLDYSRVSYKLWHSKDIVHVLLILLLSCCCFIRLSCCFVFTPQPTQLLKLSKNSVNDILKWMQDYASVIFVHLFSYRYILDMRIMLFSVI